MTTKESNKLIAEFMGGNVSPNGEEVFSTFFGDWIPMPKYHESWDELMLVVKKVNKVGEIIIRKNRTSWHGSYTNDLDGNDIRGSQKGETMLEATYKAVVEFIQWYNKQEK